MKRTCHVIEKDHLTTIQWRGRTVVKGTSPRVKEFEDYLLNDFEYPVAVEPATARTTSDFDIEKHEPQNDADLVAAVIKMGVDLQLDIIVTEE